MKPLLTILFILLTSQINSGTDNKINPVKNLRTAEQILYSRNGGTEYYLDRSVIYKLTVYKKDGYTHRRIEELNGKVISNIYY